MDEGDELIVLRVVTADMNGKNKKLARKHAHLG